MAQQKKTQRKKATRKKKGAAETAGAKSASARRKPSTKKRSPTKQGASRSSASRSPANEKPSVRKSATRKAKKKASPRRRADVGEARPAWKDAPEGPPPEEGTPTAGEGPRPLIPPLPEEEDDDLIPLPGGAEEPKREAPSDAAPGEILEAIRRGDLHVAALNALSDAAVRELARREGLRAHAAERRSETIFRLLQKPAAPPPPRSSSSRASSRCTRTGTASCAGPNAAMPSIPTTCTWPPVSSGG